MKSRLLHADGQQTWAVIFETGDEVAEVHAAGARRVGRQFQRRQQLHRRQPDRKGSVPRPGKTGIFHAGRPR